MESMRDVNRVMEREIKKGSSPLKLDHIEFGDYSYQEIMSQEKLFEVLTYLLRIHLILGQTNLYLVTPLLSFDIPSYFMGSESS